MTRLENKWRNDFPFFQANPGLIYFDNAATTQKPAAVLDTIYRFYAEENASIGRSAHKLARQADRRCKQARQIVADFLEADADEIIFTKSATESANIIAGSYAAARLQKHHNIVVTALEHNSNFLPWYELCCKEHAELRMVRLDSQGFPDLEDLEQKIDENTILAAATGASNFLHGHVPYQQIAQICHQKQVPLVLDATQLIPHERISVKQLDCDFLFFSGHKMFAPVGSGVLYAKREHVEEMTPYLVGGGIVSGDDPTHYVNGVEKLEAGTQDAAARLALASAMEYLNQTGFETLMNYEKELSRYMMKRLEAYESKGVHVLGSCSDAAPMFSLVCEGIHPFDLATLLNHYQIAVRSGKVCAQNAFSQLGVQGCVRLSLCFYNTFAEADRFFDVFDTVLKKLQRGE